MTMSWRIVRNEAIFWGKGASARGGHIAEQELEAVRGVLTPLLGAELDGLWTHFKADNPDGGVADFLRLMANQGRVGSEQIRAILLGGELTITLSEGTGRSRRRTGGRYSPLTLLGKGSMGEVFIATDPELRRQVAVKRMDPGLLEHPQLARRFRTEAQITAQLDHPGIIPVYTLEKRKNGEMEYAMKLIRGKTLADWLESIRSRIDAGQKLGERETLAARLEVFLHVSDAMSYAHARGVIHRDLKPENIMLGTFHEVTVMDWGIAKLFASDEDALAVQVTAGASHATRIGTVMGSPQYMSPEQAHGKNDELGPASDQYALGLILQELVCLSAAVEGETAIDVLVRAQAAVRKAPAGYGRSRVPREVRAVIDKACAVDPADRYADVNAMANDIRRYLRGEAVRAKPDNPIQFLLRWVSRHSALMVSSSVTLFAMMGLTVLLIVVLALGVFVYQAAAAEAMQEAVGEVVGEVGIQSHRIDAQLRRYEAILSRLAGSAEVALSRPGPPDAVYYLDEQFISGEGPPDLKAYERFAGASVSLDYPVNKLAPGVSSARSVELLRRMSTLRDPLWEALVDSDVVSVESSEADQKEIVSGRGVPIIWAYLGVEQGILTGLPGKGGYPVDYDPRKRPWYTLAIQGLSPVWSEPYKDASGMGLLVSCSLAMRDVEHEILGVATLDLDIERVIDDLLAPEELIRGASVAYLVNKEGKVLISSEQAKDAGAKGFELEPEVLKRIEGGASTGHVAKGGRLVIWSELQAVDWTYVVQGSAQDLMH